MASGLTGLCLPSVSGENLSGLLPAPLEGPRFAGTQIFSFPQYRPFVEFLTGPAGFRWVKIAFKPAEAKDGKVLKVNFAITIEIADN